MNILFAGTPENSSQILKSLIDLEDIHVKGVISQSDKRGKRGSELVESFVSKVAKESLIPCLLYTSPSPRDQRGSRMPSSA